MSYTPAEDVFADADAKIELAEALYARIQQIEGTPAERYLLQTRKVPAAAVGACIDLKYLAPPIDGRPPQDHALASLLRDAAGEVSGLQLEFVDILGARTGDEKTKQHYSLRENGCRDGLFRAGGSGDIVYLTEGCSCKALAVASLGLGPVYGGGGLTTVGFAVPPERTIVLVPDRAPDPHKWTADGKERLLDQHEAAYARAVDRLLLAKPQREILIAAAPDCTVHAACKDSDGYLPRHGAIRLKELLGRTVPGELSRDGEIKRLAAIEGALDRAAEIKKAWKDKKVLHGIPIGMLREHVEAEREKVPGTSAPVGDQTEPWDEPVELGIILNELVAELGRYIATPHSNLYAAALWAAMTHVYDRLYCAPKLALQSPAPGCGKTTFLDALSNVVCRPEALSGVAPGAFVRASDVERPTWLLDEADRFLNPKTAGEALTQAINAASYRRLARMRISVPTPDGGWKAHTFVFWCPMLLAGIRRLVDTVQDRAIVLKMQRARPGELKYRLINGTSQRFQQVQRKFIRWAQDLDQLDLNPAVPRFLHNREADLWRPLFALAAEAGGRWPERAMRSAQVIHGQRREDTDRLIELLAAIRECFDQDSSAQLATSDLITRLINRSDEPWATIKRGQPIDAYYLRTMLGGVVKRALPKQRIGKEFWRGYLRSDFTEAWDRYLYTETLGASATSATSATHPKSPGKPPLSDGADGEHPSGTIRHEADENGQKNGCGAYEADRSDDLPPQQPVDLPQEIDAVSDGADVADTPGEEGIHTHTLVCSTCGAAFEHDAHTRGRRPGKCLPCRSGGAHEHSAGQRAAHPAAAEAERVIAGMAAGERCARCGGAFRPGETAVEIAGKHYHDDDACAGEVRRLMTTREAG